MDAPLASSKRVLEPIDRLSEVLFGLIMVLGFTGSLSVVEAGRDDVRAMLAGALGCNLAWGFIDALFYLMGSLADRSRALATLVAVRAATDPDTARGLVASALPPIVASVMQPAELDAVRVRLTALPEPQRRATLQKDDWLGALGVFLLVFLSTLPVVIPFVLMPNAKPALRVSSAIAIGLLFLAGFAYGRLIGRRQIVVGCGMVVLGTALVGLTIALGG